jgi:hypothetical protein
MPEQINCGTGKDVTVTGHENANGKETALLQNGSSSENPSVVYCKHLS